MNIRPRYHEHSATEERGLETKFVSLMQKKMNERQQAGITTVEQICITSIKEFETAPQKYNSTVRAKELQTCLQQVLTGMLVNNLQEHIPKVALLGGRRFLEQRNHVSTWL